MSSTVRDRSLPDQLVVSVSDIEMGGGGVLDDFPHTQFVAELIEAYASPRFEALDVHLVFNGDTFDFLKMPVDGVYPTRITESVALAKLEQVFAVHGSFFDACRSFLEAKGGKGHVHFVVGNHDPEILFEAVQVAIRERIGHGNVLFPGFSVDFGDLRVEHGSQGDSMFRMNPDQLFVETPEGLALSLPWGAVALLDVAMPMQHLVYDLDRLQPRGRVFELLPELRDYVVGAFWEYWRGSASAWLGADPVRQVSWTMVKDVAYRFRTKSAEMVAGAMYRDLVMADGGPRIITIGHYHRADWWSYADGKLLTTGCFRDEFSLDVDGNVTSILPKVYAEFYLQAGRVVRSHLVEVDGPTPDPHHFPTSVFDVLPRILPLLGSKAQRLEMRAQEAIQHAREHAKDDDEPPA